MQITYKELQRVVERTMLRESNLPCASRYYPGISGKQVLTEGLSWEDMLKDVAAAAASSGALAVTGGAGGDIVVDTLFAIDTGKEILEAVQSAIAGLKEIGAVVGRAVKLSISSGPKAFLAEVKSILIEVMGMIGDKAKKTVNKLAKSIQSIINKVVRAISKWVAALFPADFGLAGPGFEAAVTSAISSATETAFDSTMGAIESLGETGKMLVDQGAMEQFLEDLTVGMLDYTDEIQEKLDNPDPEKQGIFKSFMAGQKLQWEMRASMTGLASLADKLGFKTDSMGEDILQALESLPSWSPAHKMLSAALPKITSFLETVRSEYIPLAGKIMSKHMSYLFACIALLQLVSDPKQRKEILAAADKKKGEKPKDTLDIAELGDVDPFTPQATKGKKGKKGKSVQERRLIIRRKRSANTKMRISERRIKKQLRRELSKRNIRRLVEQVTQASGEITPPNEASLEKATQAVQQGAKLAAGSMDPKGILSNMTAYAKKMGFGDPCEYVKANTAQVEKELMTMEEAKAALENAEDPTEGLEKFQSIVTKLGMGSFVGIGFSWKNLQMAQAAQIPARVAAAASEMVGTSAAEAATSGWLSWVPGMGSAAEAGTTMATDAVATTAALDAAAAASSTFLGVTYAAWIMIGQILVALAVAIWVYRWMVKSGVACNIKEFIVGVASKIATGAEWAYSNVIEPFVAKFKSWGGKVIDTVKSKLSDWFGSKEKEAVAESYRRHQMLTHTQLMSLHETKAMYLQERLEVELTCRRMRNVVNKLCYSTF